MPKTPDRALYYGDNVEVLRKYVREETVDLCYMDPPFNSKRNYNQIYQNIGEDRAQAQAFIDTWQWNDRVIKGFRDIRENREARYQPKLIDLARGLHRVLGEGGLFAYVVGMSEVVTEIFRVLKPTGSFYLHCDPTASHYLKLVLDAVFCSQGGNFLNEVVWKRTNARSTEGQWPRLHDVLLVYSKTDRYTFNPLSVAADKGKLPHTLITGPDGLKYQTYELTAQGKSEGDSGRPWRGFDPGKTWSRHWANDEATRDAWDRAGLIHWPKKKGGFPRRRDENPFHEEHRRVFVGDVWTDIDRLNQTAKERLGYPTQKPLALLERIIEASSNKGDLILDPCCGCGTTIAAAEHLNRRWVGIDITYQSIALILQRLEDQLGEAWPAIEKTMVQGGIPRDMESAVALAHKRDDRLRKEFEKWAVLTYTSNRAAINEKKGADAGIDGRVYFLTGKHDSGMMVLQAKSGIVDRGDIAKLHSDMLREGAVMATLITLVKPTGPMLAEAKAVGLYHHDLMDRDYNRIEIVTIQEMIENNKRLHLPLVKEKGARKVTPDEEAELPGLDSAVGDAAAADPADIFRHVRGEFEAAERKPPKRAARAPAPRKKRSSDTETK